MTEVTKPAAEAHAPTLNYARLFESVALLLVWAILIFGFGVAMPKSFPTWGNFSIIFTFLQRIFQS